MTPRRFEMWWVELDPTLGAELRKTHPAVVVSPDELNAKLATVLMAPLTSTLRGWPFRVKVEVDGKPGEIALDKTRCLARTQLKKRIGSLEKRTAKVVLKQLQELFSE